MKKRTKYIVFYLSGILCGVITPLKPEVDSPFIYLWAYGLLIVCLTALVFLILLPIPTNKRERAIARIQLREELKKNATWPWRNKHRAIM